MASTPLADALQSRPDPTARAVYGCPAAAAAMAAQKTCANAETLARDQLFGHVISVQIYTCELERAGSRAIETQKC